VSDMALEYELRPFTVDEYHRMAAGGIIDEGERVELIDGFLVEMAPIGVLHWDRHGRVVEYLIGALGQRARVYGRASIPLEHRSEPAPDIVVLAPRESGYSTPPSHSEILAMIELADSSLRKDRGPKLRLYARSGVPDYLLVDLGANVLYHFAGPYEIGYAKERALNYGDT
jgi:Uma2 family endonuclease